MFMVSFIVRMKFASEDRADVVESSARAGAGIAPGAGVRERIFRITSRTILTRC